MSSAEPTNPVAPNKTIRMLISVLALNVRCRRSRTMRRRCWAPRPSGTGVGKRRPRTDEGSSVDRGWVCPCAVRSWSPMMVVCCGPPMFGPFFCSGKYQTERRLSWAKLHPRRWSRASKWNGSERASTRYASWRDQVMVIALCWSKDTSTHISRPRPSVYGMPSNGSAKPSMTSMQNGAKARIGA